MRGAARRAVALGADLAWLAAPLLGLGGLVQALGTGSPDVPPVFAVLGIFLVPGFCLAPRLLGPERADDPLERWVFGFVLSYLGYGGLALGCRLLGLGYDVFGVAFAGLAAAALVDRARALGAGAPRRVRKFAPELACLALLALLAAVLFARPPSNDVRFFDENALASLESRSFAPGSSDVRAHGLAEPQARMRANLVHAGLAVVAAAADVSPRVVARVSAPPLLGWLMLLSLTAFVRAVAGGRVNVCLCALGVIAPLTLFFQGTEWFWFEHRMPNNPTLDKDFALFLLLPALAVAAWRSLSGEGARWALVFAAGALVSVWTHPLTPVYLLLTTFVLGLARIGRDRWRRPVALAALAALAVGASVSFVGPGAAQRRVLELLRRDAALRPRHFARPFYIFPEPALRDPERSTLDWCCGGLPTVRPRVTFGSGLVRASLAVTVLWSALLLAARLRRRRGAEDDASRAEPLALAAALCAAAAVGVLALPGGAMVAWRLLAGGLLGALAALLVAASAWRAAPAGDAHEVVALRVQAGYLALLAGLSVGAVPLLAVALHLYGAVNRLHWVYLGFFSLVFVAERLCRLAPGRLRAWLPGLLLALLVADQVATPGPALLSRAGLATSVLDEPSAIGRARVEAVLARDEGRGARAVLEAPAWLLPGDRVLPWYRNLRELPAQHALMAHAVYYREIFAEAQAFERRGDAFLADFAAYNDYHDLRPTPRLLAWLERRGVTLLALPAPRPAAARFVAALARRWPHPVRRVAANVWRIADPPRGGSAE